MNSSSTQRETPPSGLRGASAGRRVFVFVSAVVGVREPVELEVVGARARARASSSSTASSGSGRSTACSRNARHAAAGSPRRATPSAPSPRRAAGSSSAFSVSLTLQQLARRRSRASRATICVARPPNARAGAVRAGRGRARDRLPVDVAHVLQREAVGGRAARAAGAGGCRRRASPGRSRRPTSMHAREVGQVELHAGRDRDAGEAVAGADGLDAQAGCARRPRPRAAPRRPWPAAPPAPVAPTRCGPSCARSSPARRHRNAFPSPR